MIRSLDPSIDIMAAVNAVDYLVTAVEEIMYSMPGHKLAIIEKTLHGMYEFIMKVNKAVCFSVFRWLQSSIFVMV